MSATQQIISTRQQKSEQTKNKVLRTAVKLLEQYGFEYLTVKNICNVAKISNGTFFHFFKTKDEFLTYYFYEVFDKYRKTNKDFSLCNNFFENIIRIHLCYAKHCQNIGVQFVSNYYSTNNKSLASCISANNACSSLNSTFTRTVEQLERASKKGYLKNGLNLVTAANEISMIVNGIIFDWCLKDGQIDLQFYVRKMLSIYLQHIIEPEYVGIFCGKSSLVTAYKI